MENMADYNFFAHLKDLPFVEQIWLFGSRARQDHQDRADIDLAIFCPSASLSDWQTILNIIEDADTLLYIDCVRLDELDSHSDLRKAIYLQGVKVYEL